VRSALALSTKLRPTSVSSCGRRYGAADEAVHKPVIRRTGAIQAHRPWEPRSLRTLRAAQYDRRGSREWILRCPEPAAWRPPANTATVTARLTARTSRVTTQPANVKAPGEEEFAQVARLRGSRTVTEIRGSCQQPAPAEDTDPNTRTAAHPAAVAVLCCCTARSICSNYASDQVELRRFELLTSCMPVSLGHVGTGHSGWDRPGLVSGGAG